MKIVLSSETVPVFLIYVPKTPPSALVIVSKKYFDAVGGFFSTLDENLRHCTAATYITWNWRLKN
jgi:hypothetical protein